jgi:hypothetical protein
MSTHVSHQSNHCIASSQINIMPIKGFIHKVFCYLEAIFTKVPELVEKEKVGEGYAAQTV